MGLVTVFVEGGIADVMRFVFDAPVTSIVGQQLLCVGLLAAKVGDAVDDFGGRFFQTSGGVSQRSLASDAKDLLNARPAEAAKVLVECNGGLDGPRFDTTVCLVVFCERLAFRPALTCLIGGKIPRQRPRIQRKSP
jgi:hypothetical protein